MLGHKRIPSREGGVEIVVEELSTRMVQLGYNVTCFNRSGHHVSGKEFDNGHHKEYKGVKIKSVLTINRKGFAAMTSSVFGALWASVGKYDIVHFHAEGPCAMLWLPKLFGKRCIATIHGLDWQREKWKNGLGSKYIKFGEKIAAKYADEIIVLSKGVQDYFEREYDRKTVFIPNGVNRSELRETDKIKKLWGLEKDSYVLFLGRIVPEKGLQYLIEAWKNIKTSKKLVIAGGSSDTEAFMNDLKKKSPESVVFTGFQQGRVLEELYSNCYIYCLPSDLEGMPLSLLEAMSYGNCCVVSDISECTEVVEDKAMVFKKSNVEDLRGKLQFACEHPEEVRKFKAEAADFICDKYNWDDVVKQTLEVYSK